MSSQRQIWSDLCDRLTWKQYVLVSNCYGSNHDGLPELRYSTYFNRVLKVSRNKALRALASKGLALALNQDLNKEVAS